MVGGGWVVVGWWLGGWWVGGGWVGGWDKEPLTNALAAGSTKRGFVIGCVGTIQADHNAGFRGKFHGKNLTAAHHVFCNMSAGAAEELQNGPRRATGVQGF